MNEKQEIKTVMKKYTFILLLSFAWTNVCAGDDIFRHENDTPFMETRPNISSDNIGLAYNPFDSNSSDPYYQLLRAAGDRPGPGNGIGVVSISDCPLILFLFAIVYGLYARHRHTKNKILEKKKMNIGIL